MNNRHIKTGTRDRASAYSSVIQEMLQVTDRFHFHQNLLEAIKNTLNSVIPVDSRISMHYEKSEITTENDDPYKKCIAP